MVEKINLLLDRAAEFLAHRKGLLPITGAVLILLNWFVQFLPGLTWLGDNDLLLHVGIIIAIIGFLLAWAL